MQWYILVVLMCKHNDIDLPILQLDIWFNTMSALRTLSRGVVDGIILHNMKSILLGITNVTIFYGSSYVYFIYCICWLIRYTPLCGACSGKSKNTHLSLDFHSLSNRRLCWSFLSSNIQKLLLCQDSKTCIFWLVRHLPFTKYGTVCIFLNYSSGLYPTQWLA